MYNYNCKGDRYINIYEKPFAIGGDSDTIGAITGSIASAYYGIPDDLCSHAMKILDDYLLDIYMRFNGKVGEKNA